MSFTPCGSLLEVMSTALDSPVTAHAAREFVAGRLPRTAFLRCLEGSLPDADRQLFRAELEEFPEDLLTVVLEVWSLSDRAGQSFRLRSVIPERPVSLARRRAVVLTGRPQRVGSRVRPDARTDASRGVDASGGCLRAYRPERGSVV
jgi:hypothetical protein